MVVIVDDVTSKNEEGDEAILKAAKSFERDIKDLLRYAQASLYILRDDH